jgi:FAD/FMN-containing dehydrogenase
MVVPESPESLISALQTSLGSENVLCGDAVNGRESGWQTHQPCNARAIVLPGSTAELAEILRLCNDNGQSVVPYGGVTGLAQGCATTPADLAIAFDRMNAIEEIDTVGHTMTAQAGVTLLQAQQRAEQSDLYFPVDIGARDSCTLGGNVSTNAGGTKVIRYGMMRESVLGLEAVLADGTIISSMNRYIKNNSGFDLKQLFIGTEGLLGIVTRMVLRLDVQPRSHNVALVACATFDDVISVLNLSKQMLGSTLCGFEVMWDSFYDKATVPQGRHESPFTERYPLYAIVESMGVSPESDEQVFQDALQEQMQDGYLLDAVIAKSGRERDEIWAIRHEVEWLVRDAFNFDISLRSSDVREYVDTISNKIHQDVPGALVATFGHLGDNNMHISVLPQSDKQRYKELIEKHVYEALIPFSGAISAEHGVGLQKKPWLQVSRTPQELELMRTLKRTLDPRNILNPGKVIDLAP